VSAPQPPRLTVSETKIPTVTSMLSGRDTGNSPEVSVRVEWDLGNEDYALRELDKIVAVVRERIEAAKR